MVHMHNMKIYPGAFLPFYQNFDFQVVSGVKGQKMAQSKKNFCLSRSMSETPYIIRFS